MGFQKATVLVSLLLAGFVLAAQSAKADSITFTEVGDTTNVSGTGRFAGLSGSSCAPSSAEPLCIFSITAPPGFPLFSSVSNFNNVGGSGTIWTFGIQEPGTNNLSDAILISNSVTGVTITFWSDPPAAAGAAEVPVACGATVDGVAVPCNQPETGGTDFAGNITWDSGPGTPVSPPDSISYVSPTTEVPEPASLMLFGSGLAIAAGFFRRRRRLVTP